MRIPQINNTFLGYLFLILIWWGAYKSADIFGFFKTVASLWFLPAGVTLAIVLAVPLRFIFAPLIANLLLAIPFTCTVLDIECTSSVDPILHGFRLYAIYGGLGLLLRFGIKIMLPIGTLNDSHWKLGLTLVAAAIGALSGVSLHAVTGNFPWSVAWEIIRPWGVGDAIGAIIVPPLLVPLLIGVFQEDGRSAPLDWQWPSFGSLLFQCAAITVAMVIGFLLPKIYPDMSGLWYVILLPPIFFALQAGLPAAATSVFLTTMLAPPAAYYSSYGGEKLSLQFLLLICSLAGLTIGAAISDRRRAFTALKQHEQELEKQVKQRTAELEEAHGFQKHLLRSLGHDLKQPVQSINLMLDSLATEFKEDPKIQSVEKAKRVGQSAADFVGKVLDFAKRDAGRVDVTLEQVSIVEVFDVLAATFEPMATAKGVKLEIEPSTRWVLTDQSLLIEALSNLIDNAIRLSISGQSVKLALEERADHLLISVTDEIVGIDGNGVQQTGFGLDIVRQICSMIGADFEQKPNMATLALPTKVTEKLA
ncbi:MAG: ATP-binding protein [Rhizobiaceae bacterium]